MVGRWTEVEFDESLLGKPWNQPFSQSRIPAPHHSDQAGHGITSHLSNRRLSLANGGTLEGGQTIVQILDPGANPPAPVDRLLGAKQKEEGASQANPG